MLDATEGPGRPISDLSNVFLLSDEQLLSILKMARADSPVSYLEDTDITESPRYIG